MIRAFIYKTWYNETMYFYEDMWELITAIMGDKAVVAVYDGL